MVDESDDQHPLNPPTRVEPQPGQESVWEYPRPPRVERVHARLRVVIGGITIADTRGGYRVLETSHPPNYYLPVADIAPDALTPEPAVSRCEWKGRAQYFTVRGGARIESRAAWTYPEPNAAYEELRDMVAFYPALMDACFVDEELVCAQPGGFYGGWITASVVGPFKGAPGTHGW